MSVSTIEGIENKKETEIFNVSVSFFQFSYFVTIKLIITSTMVLIILFYLGNLYINHKFPYDDALH